jgi:hypothetical protein
MNKEQLDEIESKLKTLSRIELEYFRDWLMDHYPIMGMDHDIDTIIMTMDGVGAEYKDINNLLLNINDHSKWEIEESYYLEEEKSGYYIILEVQELMENLSDNEYELFIKALKEKYPIYEKENITRLDIINNTFGKNNYAKWEEALVVLKEIKEK